MVAYTAGTHGRRGFTLTELMVVISLVGIIAAVSAPPIYNFIQSNRLQTSRDRMVADMQYARSLAISSGRILRFAATEAGYELTDAATGDVLRTRDFDHGLALSAAVTVDFFPWGMADNAVMSISNPAGTSRINVLPTGIVEVH
ncbi:MAG TPA: GspH/FimT family pseudopilin [Candidatus Krumholzibacteria bacterium]|nr:GspH/FimT family pseudopilin [Candidatus Krumholzibacteria bacterium]